MRYSRPPMSARDPAEPLAALREQLPALQVHGSLARSLKCDVLAASLAGRPVVVKWLARPEPPWAWLPRNAIVDGPAARLVDLECAGDHPEAWDHALLWANLPAALRTAVEADFAVDAGPRGRSFRACVVFALVRELKFARSAALSAALRATLHTAVAALRSHG